MPGHVVKECGSEAAFTPLTFREIKRRLEAAGFVENQPEGQSRQIFPALGRDRRHRYRQKHDFPVGTLRSILSQAHIHPDD